MLRSRIWLSVCLLLSLSLNGVLLWQGYSSADTPLVGTTLPSQSEHSAAQNLPVTEPVNTSQLRFDSATLTEAQPVADAAQRETLLSQAQQWLAEQNLLELRLFLRDYLQQHPIDGDFLLLEAELNVHTELLSDALAYFYSLKRLPLTAAQLQQIELRIDSLSGDTIYQLQQAYSWDTLAIFVEPLLQLEPQNRLFILTLAEAYARQQQFSLMENILAALDDDDPGAENIRQLANTLLAGQQDSDSAGNPQQTELPQRGLSVALQQVGDQFIVSGILSDVEVNLLIDTGASISALAGQYFAKLRLHYDAEYLGRFSVNTASGKMMAPMYKFSYLRIGHALVRDISVVVLPIRDTSGANGLLGMNFLREFDFKIDQRNSRLWLNR